MNTIKNTIFDILLGSNIVLGGLIGIQLWQKDITTLVMSVFLVLLLFYYGTQTRKGKNIDKARYNLGFWVLVLGFYLLLMILVYSMYQYNDIIGMILLIPVIPWAVWAYLYIKKNRLYHHLFNRMFEKK